MNSKDRLALKRIDSKLAELRKFQLDARTEIGRLEANVQGAEDTIWDLKEAKNRILDKDENR